MITQLSSKSTEQARYVISCTDLYEDSLLLYDPVSREFWLAQHESELSEAFFFTGDLYTISVNDKEAALYSYLYYQKNINIHHKYSPLKFLLVCNELKVFDAYSMKSYPLAKYGKEIPRGMEKTKFKSREDRDLVIEELINKGYICIFDKDLHDELSGEANES